MPGEFALSAARKVEIHEGALHAAHAKLYEAQHEKAVWLQVANTTKAGEAESNTAKGNAAQHGLMIKYMTTSIEHHTRELDKWRKLAEAEAEEGDRVAGEEPIPFPKTADA